MRVFDWGTAIQSRGFVVEVRGNKNQPTKPENSEKKSKQKQSDKQKQSSKQSKSDDGSLRF